jgi:hypothetical protein
VKDVITIKELTMELVMFVTICVILVTKPSLVSPVLLTLSEMLLQVVIVNQDIMITLLPFVKDVHITVPLVPDVELTLHVATPVLPDSLPVEEIVSVLKENLMMVLNVNHVVLNVNLVQDQPVTVTYVLPIETKTLQVAHVQMVNTNKMECVKHVLTDVKNVSTKLITVNHVPEIEKTPQLVLVHMDLMMMDPMLTVQLVTTDVYLVPTKPILVNNVKKPETITQSVIALLDIMMTVPGNVNLVPINV